jgi:hypothetical protein
MSLGVDRIGIEGVADPFRQLCMAHVLGVSDGFEELSVAPGTADVFGRTASRDVDQARVCDTRHGIGDMLDLDRVLPAVAEVVEIFEGLHVDVFKPRCCPNAPARKVPRSIREGALDMARDIAKTAAYTTSRRERKKVEMLFAHLKRILRLDRLRLRGPNGARDEFLLAAATQNLRKFAKLIPMPQLQPA